VPLGDEAVEAPSGLRFICGEAIAKKVSFRGKDGVGLALVSGEFTDEGEDFGNIGGCG
jgi:hypothetical protein